MLLLKLVMARFRRVSHRALTAKLTAMSEEFDPLPAATKSRPPKQNGKVTMALFLDDECLIDTVREKMTTGDDWEVFVNPWEHDSLRYLPATCFFETSAAQPEHDSPEDWGAEMGRQVAAFHKRLTDFLDAKYADLDDHAGSLLSDNPEEWSEAHQKDWRHKKHWGEDRPFDDSDEPWERPLIAALPQLCVRGHDWYLYFCL